MHRLQYKGKQHILQDEKDTLVYLELPQPTGGRLVSEQERRRAGWIVCVVCSVQMSFCTDYQNCSMFWEKIEFFKRGVSVFIWWRFSWHPPYAFFGCYTGTNVFFCSLSEVIQHNVASCSHCSDKPTCNRCCCSQTSTVMQMAHCKQTHKQRTSLALIVLVPLT